MKKLYLFLCAALALAACGQINQEEGKPEEAKSVQDLVFDFNVRYPGETKVVKAGWEDGDKVFVFFEGVTTGYVTMTYDKSNKSWGIPVFNGTADVSSLTASGKKLTAVFLPFGSSATASYDNGWKFSKTYYTYYMRAEKVEYTVNTSNGITTLSANMDMKNPDDYVQFFVDDADATDGGYTLATDAVIPVGVTSIDRDGNIVEMIKNAGDDMVGYAYGSGNNKGYLFSGRIVSSSSYSYDGYYFAKTKAADNSRADYFVTGNTLTSHSAVKLPANNNVYESESYGADGKWIPVGPMRFVNFYFSSLQGQPNLAWATCNYGASKPEEIGTRLSFIDATAYDNSNKTISLPSKDVFNLLGNKDIVKHTAITVHGKPGFVFSASRGFIFLPCTSIAPKSCDYWSGKEDQDNTGKAWYFRFEGTPVEGADYMFSQGKDATLSVRMIR
jgi:hypothetical protein